MKAQPKPPVSTTPFWQAILPILFLAGLIGYGLIYRGLAPDLKPLPLELIFILAAAFTILQLRCTGHRWQEVQESIVSRLAAALPAFFILFCIGLVISSWIVCGTIPMLVCWGLEAVNPQYFYAVAFLAPIVFSTLTGTSWGSVGTIGVVLLGMAMALDAHLGITAGAIIGGAYFGDKLSPLSDTTNLAALAAGVPLFDHIRSMLVTTLPSAIIAGILYTWLGFVYPPSVTGADRALLQPFLDALGSIFHFSPWLLVPPAIVLVGSLRQWPTVPVLITSVIAAGALAALTQSFTISDIFTAVHTGFDSATMIPSAADLPTTVTVLLDRGGLYALNEAITTAFMVFVFIGALDHIRAMPTVVDHLLGGVKTAAGTIATSLVATGLTNAMTSNQYATSFIVGDAFRSKYDAVGVPRKVLSRSLEDTGTMIESLVPWTATALYMVETLGVPWQDYWHWQFLSLINIGVAFFLAFTGWGCFLPSRSPASPAPLSADGHPRS